MAAFALGSLAAASHGGIRPAPPSPRQHGAFRAHALAARGDNLNKQHQSGGALEVARERARQALDPGLPHDVAALLQGMALGDDSGLSNSVKDSFRRSSLTHVTAASGQNIVFLFILLLPLLALLGAPMRVRFAICAAVAVAYVPIAGSESPIRRACVMALVALIARRRGSRGSVWHALLAAAVITTLVDPSAPFALGWQLSFAAVAAMVLVGRRLQLRLEGFGLPALLAEPLAATVAATIGTSPLIAHSVGRLSLVSVPANVVAAPAVAVSMLLALAAAAVAQISVFAGGLLAWAAALPAAAVIEVATVFADPSWASVQWRPNLGETVAVAAVGLSLCVLQLPAAPRFRRPLRRGRMTRRRLAAAGAAVVVAAAVATGGATRIDSVADIWPQRTVSQLLGLQSTQPDDQGPRIAFIDVGQGDAEVVADGTRGILIDTGPPGTAISAKLRRLGVESLAAVLLTHGQADHAGALDDVLSGMRPDLVIDGTETAPGHESALVHKLIAESGVNVALPKPGLVVSAGRASITLISPEAKSQSGSDPNGASAVAVGRAGSLTALLTADSESPSLAALTLGHVDVFKLPHHGSTDSGLRSVLAATTPRLTVVEVGRNPYGHPANQSVRDAGLWGPVMRTDQGGSVTVRSDGRGRITVRRLDTG